MCDPFNGENVAMAFWLRIAVAEADPCEPQVRVFGRRWGLSTVDPVSAGLDGGRTWWRTSRRPA
jgi:hypothetical protein